MLLNSVEMRTSCVARRRLLRFCPLHMRQNTIALTKDTEILNRCRHMTLKMIRTISKKWKHIYRRADISI